MELISEDSVRFVAGATHEQPSSMERKGRPTVNDHRFVTRAMIEGSERTHNRRRNRNREQNRSHSKTISGKLSQSESTPIGGNSLRNLDRGSITSYVVQAHLAVLLLGGLLPT